MLDVTLSGMGVPDEVSTHTKSNIMYPNVSSAIKLVPLNETVNTSSTKVIKFFNSM